MPLSEVVGNRGTLPPVHMVSEEPKENTGSTVGVTVTAKLVVLAHKPAVGVNVYTPLFWLLTTVGFQVPVMPLSDVVGKRGGVELLQMVSAVPKLNTGVTFGLTVTVKLAPVAHTPAAGVKVYVPDA